MLKNYNLSILMSFLGLWLTSFFEDKFQILVGFLLIFSFGILHGANDIAIFKKINILYTQVSNIKLITYYGIVVLFSAILFAIIPWLALIFFIIVSSYHFGEQHWQDIEGYKWKWLKSIYYFNYGIFILLLLFVFHSKEVKQIIFSITFIDVGFINFVYLLVFFSITLSLFFAFNFYNSLKFQKKILEELLYLLVFAVLFKVGSLIWGFTLYFIFWHSIPSLHDQIKFLYGNYSFNNFKLYFKSAFLYWMLSLLGIVIIYFLFKEKRIFDALFFSFLAAITFPHSFVILKMSKKKKKI